MRTTLEIDNEILAAERRLEELRNERSLASVEEYIQEIRAKIAAEPPKKLSEEESAEATDRILREGGPLADLLRKNLAEQEDISYRIAAVEAVEQFLR